MKGKGIVFDYFVRYAATPQKKVATYGCKFCLKKYALHATRMAEHLMTCTKCPEDVKLKLKQGNKNLIKKGFAVSISPKSPSAPSTSRAFFEGMQDAVIDIDTDTDNSASTSAMLPTTPTSSSCSHFSASRSSLGSFVDRTTDIEQEIIWKHLATAIFATGTPLSITENKYWVETFKRIRPSLTLPSRYMLSNSLLNDVHKDVSDSVGALISTANFIGVQCDCWTNIRNEGILNFIITTPKPVFYKTLITKEQRHTGEYMSEKLSELFEEVGVKRIIGCVTDNARNMTKAWELLQIKYPDFPISYYGCASHILNLLTSDIGKLKSVESMVNSAKSIVKTVKNKSVLSAAFARIQKEKLPGNEIQSLKLPVATRWASVMMCLESLKINKIVLQTLAISEVGCNELDKNERSNILDNDVFWIKVDFFLSLLRPIKKWIKIFQSDQSKISEVVEAFQEIKSHFATEIQIPNCPLLMDEKSKIMKAVEDRGCMCLKPIHYAANILDPKFKGQKLRNSHCNEGLQYIYQLASYIDDIDVGDIFQNIAEYRSGSGFFALEFVKVSMENIKISAVDFWKGICTNFPLQKIAEAVLSMSPTSAATERSFSAQGFIHSKKRNRLTTVRAGMLTYVHHNLNLLAKKKNLTKGEKNKEGSEYSESTARDEEGAEQLMENADLNESNETESEEEEEEEIYEEMTKCLQADSEVSSELGSEVDSEHD